MAKISGNRSALQERRMLRFLQQRESIRVEIETLDAQDRKKQEKELNRRMATFKKHLENSAAGRLKKAESAVEQKLKAYDVQVYLSHRAVNHSAAKAIFAALREGRDIEPILQIQDGKNRALLCKRQAIVSKLQARMDALTQNPADEAAALEAEAAYDAAYREQKRLLDAAYRKKRESSEAALRKKLQAVEEKLAKTVPDDRAPTLPEDVLLRVRGLKMHFGGLKAVDDLSFDVKKGEIFGLIGPNGAGKTTVFNCITRFYNATDGEMYFVGRQGRTVDLRQFRVHDVILHGIVRTFQNVEVIREASVLENLLIAGHRQYGSSLLAQALHLPALKKEERLIRERAIKVLDFMGLADYKDWYAFGLPYGVLKRIEIARTLMCDPKLIILDEPAAGLNDTETAELARLIRRIRDEYDCTILLVEHDMGLVMDICDTVCAISFGKLLAIGTTDQVQADRNVQMAYLGVEEEE